MKIPEESRANIVTVTYLISETETIFAEKQLRIPEDAWKVADRVSGHVDHTYHMTDEGLGSWVRSRIQEQG